MAGSQEWLDKLNSLGSKPTYESKYQGTLDTLLDKIVNRQGFSYDFNADPLYQQYKDQYTKLGNEAGMNAAANVSTLTGGYGNSYAATAATQANQQYLTQLNNIIPQLEAAAMDKYQMETQNLYNQYGAVGDAENRNYSTYRDSVSDYYADRDYYYNGYNNAANMEYQQNRDAIADSQWSQNFDYNKYINDRNFAYQKERDAVSDEQWNKQYALSAAKLRSSSGNSGNATVDYNENAAGEHTYNNYVNHLTDMINKDHYTEDQALSEAKKLRDSGKISTSQYIDILFDTGMISESDYKNLLKKGY